MHFSTYQVERKICWMFSTKEKSAKSHIPKRSFTVYFHCELDVAFDLSKVTGTLALEEWNTE